MWRPPPRVCQCARHGLTLRLTTSYLVQLRPEEDMLWTPSLGNGLEVFEQADIRWKRRQGGLSNGLILKDEASGLIVIFQTNDVTLPFRHTA